MYNFEPMRLAIIPIILFAAISAAAQAATLETVLAKRLALKERLAVVNGKTVTKKGIALSEVCDLGDPVSARVFRDYGAMWVGNNDAFAGYRQNPDGTFVADCVFDDESEVAAYHAAVPTKTAMIGPTSVTLRADAMDALVAARAEALAAKLNITPRGGSTAARRTFGDTLRLWRSRFLPGLDHWVALGKIKRADADAAKRLEIRKQVAQVLAWEENDWFFSTDFSKSILYSVAAPGASQHIFMIALDVEQFSTPRVRAILAKHGWFQTVKSDLPHFTYMGVQEKELPALGLEPVTVGGQRFWIPRT